MQFIVTLTMDGVAPPRIIRMHKMAMSMIGSPNHAKVLFILINTYNYMRNLIFIKKTFRSLFYYISATESSSCQDFGGTLLEGDDGKLSCYLYHKGRHIYDFEASKQYCEEFGGSLVTINGPKDQENAFKMIKRGITANQNSVI